MKRLVLASVLGLAVFSMAGVANATTYTLSNTACSTINVDPEAGECIGFFRGNVQQNDFDPNADVFGTVTGLFGHTEWDEIQRDENFQGGKTGEFTIEDNLFGSVAVLLKSGPEWAGYLFEEGFEGLLKYATGNENGLSNYIVFGKGEKDDQPEPVPLPAAAWMLLAGLGGLFALRRRRA